MTPYWEAAEINKVWYIREEHDGRIIAVASQEDAVYIVMLHNDFVIRMEGRRI